MHHRPNNTIQHNLQLRRHNGLIARIRNGRIGHEILHADRRARPVLADLVVAVGEDSRGEGVVEDGVVVVFFVTAVAGAAAVREVVFERDVCWGRGGGGR